MFLPSQKLSGHPRGKVTGGGLVRRREQRDELSTWKDCGDVAKNRELLESALCMVSKRLKNEMPSGMA